MSRKILFAVITMLCVLINSAAIFGQEPATIEQAIEKVKKITDSNPVKQNELRAKEAFDIITKRIRNINSTDDGADLPEFEDYGRELAYLRGDKPRPGQDKGVPVSGEELMKWVWQNRAARCAESVDLLTLILNGAGVKVSSFTSTAGHQIPVINFASDGDPDNPWAWGSDAVAMDAWLKRTLRAEDAWNEKWYFKNGKAYVATATAPFSNRQRIKQFSERGREFIKRYCQQYRQMLDKYFKIPARFRKDLEFRPEEDTKLEEWDKTYQNIQNDFDQGMRKAETSKKSSPQQYGESCRQTKEKAQNALEQLNRDISPYRYCSADVDNFFQVILNARNRVGAACNATTSAATSNDVPADIVTGTGEVKVTAFYILLLSTGGLYVGSEESLKGRPSCGFEGGGLDCNLPIKWSKLAGPFGNQDEAQAELCRSITQTKIYPLGIGLKGQWRGSDKWYGLWNASVSNCRTK